MSVHIKLKNLATIAKGQQATEQEPQGPIPEEVMQEITQQLEKDAMAREVCRQLQHDQEDDETEGLTQEQYQQVTWRFRNSWQYVRR